MSSSSKRKTEPAHYMLKIENFSILTEAKSMKIESDVFEASGYKWRLELYPNGYGIEEKSGGKNISLYLVICGTESLSKGWELFVDVSFFVYSHKGHNYVTFQATDAYGNRIRFNESKKIWGFDKLISLESFKESTNGYLLNDACVFGVEVFAVPGFAQKDRCLSFIKPPTSMNTYTWRIDNFSDVKEVTIDSDVFKLGNVKWKLWLSPKGNGEGKDTHLSLYLEVFDHALFPDDWRVYANFKIRVMNQSCKENIEHVVLVLVAVA
uniref:MATH domain and coiled-coil domain-containing protein At3g58200-like n=1 Tax=Erigeron canadensis TaxID=72917 RepID=UPI001CB923D7|nr:MATH domain and coiled-coil domain-containing protein At3g58200-like [Erigeron canadensis]